MLADDLLDLPGVHLLALDREEPSRVHPGGLLRLRVETTPPEVVACHGCGVLAAAHGRLEHRLGDAPCCATPVQIVWRKRRWRCRERRCSVSTWTEEHPGLPARAKLTVRAVEWAVQTGRVRWSV